MSEKWIMVSVVAAILVASFFFKYDDEKDAYYREAIKRQRDYQSKHANQPAAPGEGSTEDAAVAAVAIKDVAESTRIAKTGVNERVADRGSATDGGAASPSMIARRLDGDGQRIDCVYECNPDPKYPNDPSWLSLHSDGTFQEHHLLSVGPAVPAELRGHGDLSGRYRLLDDSLQLTLPADPKAGHGELRHDYDLLVVGDRDERYRPVRLLVNGKRVELKQ